ncbi:hypothetical protein BDW75DRAFT_161791 [Aspergillus navahoensis]
MCWISNGRILLEACTVALLLVGLLSARCDGATSGPLTIHACEKSALDRVVYSVSHAAYRARTGMSERMIDRITSGAPLGFENILKSSLRSCCWTARDWCPPGANSPHFPGSVRRSASLSRQTTEDKDNSESYSRPSYWVDVRQVPAADNGSCSILSSPF